MPTVQANGIDIYYEVQGEGEPLVLIPYLAADQACYAFQIADYAKRAEVVVFENCSHAPIYEDVDGFNQRTLTFLQQNAG
jgi:pimeloyl-ACP methyl ester carboxylesterase